MRIFYFLFSFFLALNSFGQFRQSYYLDWQWQNQCLKVNDFDSCLLNFDILLEDFSNDFDISVENTVFLDCDEEEIAYLKNHNINSELSLSFQYGIERKHLKIKGNIKPFIFANGKLQKLIYCELVVNKIDGPKSRKSISVVDHSILSTGKWYKIGVTENGIHKITYQNLSDLGIDVSSINPNHIRIYGRPAGMLPISNAIDRVDDLEELSIQIIGGSDGHFDENDLILFYGQSPHTWSFSNDAFSRQTHFFEDKTYYFINCDLGQGQRVGNQNTISTFDTSIVTFDDYLIHEKNEVNFIKSGSNWFGDVFDLISNKTFTFNFPNRVGTAKLKMVLAARASSPYNSSFTMNSSAIADRVYSISGVNGNYNYANTVVIDEQLNSGSDNITLSLDFNSASSSARGWVDFIEINAQRALKMSGNQMEFRSISSVKPNTNSQFVISNPTSNLVIWDITNPLQPQSLQTEISNSNLTFISSTDELKQFIAFNGGYQNVQLLGKIANQDLHALEGVDYVIISHPNFLTQANRLADFHRSQGLSVEVVTPQQIYNEFSAASQDVSAIRDFARFLYQKDYPLKYMLLFGDASYDPKNRVPDNTNYIVSYQSSNSTNSLYSYASDDFFAILDSSEGISSNDSSIPFLDIGVGRFPVQSIVEAQEAVDKVINYNSTDAYGDWRLNMCFVGDDNDVLETVHTAQAEQLADYITVNYPNMNVDKIYLDAFEQESSTGGQRCRKVNEAITNTINKGSFLINYTGHGGELGWAHERILEIEDVNAWSNTNKLPLFMTATCEFGRYDDPERISAGEHVFLKKNGGAIALLTTSRVVFTNGNLNLNKAFLQNLFPKSTDSIMPRLGDVLMRTKNTVSGVDDSNHRNFTLLGDPAITLAYPKYDIVINSIQDSAKALGKITISGEIQSQGIRMKDFNGFVFPKVFDKPADYQTLGQDESPILIFDLQKNILFNGKSTVQNGTFSFSFVVPKDINYDFGNGKISLYAQSDLSQQIVDASGNNMDLIIGGTAEDYPIDDDGPQITLFMNDTNFVRGGITHHSPNLLAFVFDENGINTVGNGIGHDMTAILNQESSNPIVLNDFYQYNTNSYKYGTINYPFTNLEEGTHTLSVKVWDVFNNSSESTTDFRVISSENLSIQNLINYPNPVVDFTAFYFEHNQSGMPLEVYLCITDLQGKIVKEIEDNMVPNGFRYGPIRWDGTSNFGDKLKSGMYIYTLKAKASDGHVSTNSGRLILIH
jgi:hypothetical protein